MRQAFEKAAQVYEGVKKSVQEKWDGFKKKFEGTKSEMSQEVMSAKSPDDLIALGKKLQEQGEALKIEEQGVKQEEADEDGKYEIGKDEMIDADYEEGHEMNKAFNENKAAEKATKEKEEAEMRAKELEDMKLKDETESTAKAEAILNNLNPGKKKTGFTDEEIKKYGIRTDEENERAVKSMNKDLKVVNDAMKKAEKPKPSAEDIEDAKKIFGKVIRGPETSEQFGNSQIFLFEGSDGRKRYYALRRNSEGQLEGNEFSLMEKEGGQWKNFVSTGLHRLDQHDPNVSVGPTYQMHAPKLEKMEALLQSHKIEI